MASPIVLYEIRDGVATITLNRPEAKNALSGALMQALAEAFESAQKDPEVRVVILTGAGDAFCAGVDLKEFGQSAPAPAEPSAGPQPDCWRAMEACTRPIIGAVHGPAITGGFELALACDVLIASTRARFADTHARVGVLPGAGLSQHLSRAIGIYRAKYLSLTGNFLSASDALEWGLVSHVVEPQALLPLARQIAGDMLTVMPHMLEPMKTLLDDGFALDLADALALESRRSREQMTQRPPQADARAAFASVRERGRQQS